MSTVIESSSAHVVYEIGSTPESVFGVPFLHPGLKDDLVVLIGEDETLHFDLAGSIVTLLTPVSETTVTIRLSVRVQRLGVLPTAGRVDLDAVNREFDRIYFIMQQANLGGVDPFDPLFMRRAQNLDDLDDVEAARGNLGVAPTITSIDAFPGLRLAGATAAFLLDGVRDGYWVWDPTLPKAWHQADPYNYVYVAADEDADGAWCHYHADTRNAYWGGLSTPARYLRSKSGIRLGDAANIRSAIGSTDTWLGQIGGNPNTWAYMESATVLSLRTNNGIAGVFGSRATTSNANALYAVAHNNSPNAGHGAWAAYFEGVAGVNATGIARAGEFNAVNLRQAPKARSNPLQRGGETPHMDAGVRPQDLTFVLALSAGGDYMVHGFSQPLDEYLRINWLGAMDGEHEAGAHCGIMVRHNALVRETYPWGYGPVIRMAQGHGFSWYGSEDGQEAVRLWSDVSDNDYRQGLRFSDDGFRILSNYGATELFVPRVASPTSFLRVTAGTAVAIPEIAAVGSGDVDLRLSTSGNGVLVLPSNAAGSGSMTPTVRVPVKGRNGQTIHLLGTLT